MGATVPHVPQKTMDRLQAMFASTALLGLTVALWLMPPEQTLGSVIKVIFLHGALVRVGLLSFAAAGILSLAYLFMRKPSLYLWAIAAQKSAVLLWILYTLTSMISTQLSWGEWIAWEEPRVRASFHVLWFSAACLLLGLWMGHRTFAAFANLLVTTVAWILIRGASIIRHPFDPIGTSGSSKYQTLFWVMVVALIVLAGVLVRWLHTKERPLQTTV